VKNDKKEKEKQIGLTIPFVVLSNALPLSFFFRTMPGPPSTHSAEIYIEQTSPHNPNLV
jgi:hypothetical protein